VSAEPDLQKVLDAVLEGVVVLDADGAVLHLNGEASRLLEASAEAAVGAPLESAVGAHHPAAKLARSVLASGRAAVQDDVALARRYADDALIDLAVSPIVEPDRSVSGAVVVLRDRTLRHALERIESQRARLAVYGRIATGIAHEVKNPLGGIRGAGELLAARAGDDKTRKTALLIVQEVDRITSLVDDLMVFTRGEDLRLEPTNLHRVLDEMLDLLAMDPVASGVGLERVYDPSIPELRADADRLTQVFLNLARNACQAMEEAGGRLRIETRMALDQRLTDDAGRRWPAVAVRFEDSGPGIAPELVERLGTPFLTTRACGTGLGLAVSQHWIARHHGTLRIANRPGGGARAVVLLPLRRKEGAS
jgi:two-component system, NtrC family, nitrogen regulation sensor histidine kinase GlnL